MKKVLLLSILFIFGVKMTFAQQNPQISFPIPELGNCNNVQTCKVYCDQPQNHKSCTAFAKAKSLYKQRALKRTAKDEQLLAKAEQNLKCNSFETCKALCDKQENYTKCAALLQDQVTSDDRAMFEKYKPLIKGYLGCGSIVTCMAFCINPLNTKKCQELAERIEVEQGGTPNIESPDPEVWCPKVSSECKWDGTTCVCMGPETCTKANDVPGCTWDGAQCSCPGIEGPPPEEWCPKAGPGCAWDGKHCICPGTSETPIGEGPQEPGNIWCPKIGPYCVWDGSSCTCWDECVKAGGKWTGKVCEYQGGTSQTTLEPNTESPGVSCVKNPDCKWTGETCVCAAVQAPKVQGVTKSRGLLQQLLDFILGR